MFAFTAILHLLRAPSRRRRPAPLPHPGPGEGPAKEVPASPEEGQGEGQAHRQKARDLKEEGPKRRKPLGEEEGGEAEEGEVRKAPGHQTSMNASARPTRKAFSMRSRASTESLGRTAVLSPPG